MYLRHFNRLHAVEGDLTEAADFDNVLLVRRLEESQNDLLRAGSTWS